MFCTPLGQSGVSNTRWCSARLKNNHASAAHAAALSHTSKRIRCQQHAQVLYTPPGRSDVSSTHRCSAHLKTFQSNFPRRRIFASSQDTLCNHVARLWAQGKNCYIAQHKGLHALCYQGGVFAEVIPRTILSSNASGTAQISSLAPYTSCTKSHSLLLRDIPAEQK